MCAPATNNQFLLLLLIHHLELLHCFWLLKWFWNYRYHLEHVERLRLALPPRSSIRSHNWKGRSFLLLASCNRPHIYPHFSLPTTPANAGSGMHAVRACMWEREEIEHFSSLFHECEANIKRMKWFVSVSVSSFASSLCRLVLSQRNLYVKTKGRGWRDVSIRVDGDWNTSIQFSRDYYAVFVVKRRRCHR